MFDKNYYFVRKLKHLRYFPGNIMRRISSQPLQVVGIDLDIRNKKSKKYQVSKKKQLLLNLILFGN